MDGTNEKKKRKKGRVANKERRLSSREVMALEMTSVGTPNVLEEDVIDMSLVNPMVKKNSSVKGRAHWSKVKNAVTGNTFKEMRRNKVRRLSKVKKAREVIVDIDERPGHCINEASGHTQSGDEEATIDDEEATSEEQGESTNTIRIAAFDYVGVENGELDMKVGDKIEFLEAINDEDDWGKGKNLRTGDVGDCPMGYLEHNL